MTTMAELVVDGTVSANVSVADLTTYRLGGPALWFAEPETIDAFMSVAGAARREGLEVLLIGRGSNVVISDRGFEGLVVRLGPGFRALDISEGIVRAGAALSLPKLARSTVDAGWGGLEFYVGIPGSVGGAVAMNAGFYGTETGDVLIDALVADLDGGRVETWSVGQLDFAYRSSAVTDRHAVLEARFAVAPVDRGAAQAAMREVTRWRKDRQPGGTHNAGSVFKNPPGDAAGRIIDELGLKGASVRDVAVSTKHANFFIAGADATAADVHALVHEIRAHVEDATGIRLEPEIRFYGDFGMTP